MDTIYDPASLSDEVLETLYKDASKQVDNYLALQYEYLQEIERRRHNEQVSREFILGWAFGYANA